MLMFLFWLWQSAAGSLTTQEISYGEFKSHLAEGRIEEVLVMPDAVEGLLKSDDGKKRFRATRVEPDDGLVAALERAKVKFRGERPGAFSQFLWGILLPVLFLMLLFTVMMRRTPGQSVLSFGRSKAKLVADQDTGVSFQDVAGCDEAKVPFFSLSGSDFVEMFVGVGAARVRDLFQQAVQKAPCIIFIDELDAIGRARGVHVGTVNDEREQTLNQLLVEMDGFEVNKGVILLAATNRPDVLDKALLRPGRFDRQIVVDAPDLEGRMAILAVHVRNKPLSPDVDLKRIAQGTPGFSGADLANAVNEAALLAARRNATQISHRDIEDAVERVVAGPERKSRRLDPEEKRRVAYHEVGHALVAAHSAHSDPVHKISIVPRGRMALGYTLQLPDEEQHLATRAMLLDKLKGLLGGRAAEELVFGEISTGAANDLEQATNLARQMICLYGMSEKLGLTHCGRREGWYLEQSLQLDCSEDTAQRVDVEVRALLARCYEEAKQILDAHRDELELVATELLKTESLDGATFKRLLGLAPAPQAVAVPPGVTST